MGFRIEPLANLLKNNIGPLVKDRFKEILLSGNDSEICAWFIFMGYKLYYDERLILYHHLDEKRLTKGYLESLERSDGKSILGIYTCILTVKYLLIENRNPIDKVFIFIYCLLRLLKSPIRFLKVIYYENKIKQVHMKPSL